MSKFTNPLNSVKIASPCSQNWGEMIGTERKRFCGECKLNVYNLSGMSRREAENLLLNSEGRLCVRFYRRADGSVLTKDCPVGWQAIKRRASKTATAFASLVFAALGSVGLTNYFAKSSKPEVGGMMLPVLKISTGEIAVEKTNANVFIQRKPIAPMEYMPEVGGLAYYEVGGRTSNSKQIKKRNTNKRQR